MEHIQTFNFNHNIIRTLLLDEEIWFIFDDVLEVLNLNKIDAISTIDTDELTSYNFSKSIGIVNIVNESGLYSLVFKSNKDNAKKFRKWLTKEVLPTINKHGAYLQDDILEQALANPDFLISLANKIKEEQEKRILLEKDNVELMLINQEMKEKVEYYDELVSRNTLTNFRDTAKELKVKEKDFIAFLIENNYLYRNQKGKLFPCVKKNKELFEIKECFNPKTKWSGVQTLVTPKGRETFRLLLQDSKATS